MLRAIWDFFVKLLSAPPAPAIPITPEPTAPLPVVTDPPQGPLVRPPGLPPGNHYAGRIRAQMESEYRYLYSFAQISGPMAGGARKAAQFILANRARFERLASAFPGVPWHLFAIISAMEMGLNFNGSILNGDDWSQKTHNYPAGLGPWNSWEEAAEWGFVHECKGWGFNWASMNWRDVGTYFYFCESYNGHNARMNDQGPITTPPYASPYVYSGTQFYVKGKKQENPTRFNPELVSQQAGCMSIAKALEEAGAKLF